MSSLATRVLQLDLRGQLPPRHAPGDFTTPVETNAPPVSSSAARLWGPKLTKSWQRTLPNDANVTAIFLNSHSPRPIATAIPSGTESCCVRTNWAVRLALAADSRHSSVQYLVRYAWWIAVYDHQRLEPPVCIVTLCSAVAILSGGGADRKLLPPFSSAWIGTYFAHSSRRDPVWGWWTIFCNEK